VWYIVLDGFCPWVRGSCIACSRGQGGNRYCALTLVKAIVVPVMKTGKDSRNTASYRPFSLTSTMGKTMERIINTRLNWLLETNNIVANEQAGFRIHRSTSKQITKFNQYIKDALENKHV
jgi:hypothetical protein